MAEEVKRIATREAYGKVLAELGEEHPELVVLDADLSSSTKTAVFGKKFPDRFFNCGIAEANMMSIAAGLAACGKTVFASSFAMFASGRAFEQIRNSIGYPHLNVRIGATHGGITVGEDGASHQCLEDLAIMRAIPGMTVICPADAVEVECLVRASMDYDGPIYFRFGRSAVPVVNDRPDFHFEWGKGILQREGSDVTLVATGIMLNSAMEAAEMLAKDGISAEIIDIHTIKPIDKDIICRSAAKTGKVFTIEEHSVVGGLGSAVCEALSEELPTKVKRIGIYDIYGESASAAVLMEYYRLDGKGVYEQVKEALN